MSKSDVSKLYVNLSASQTRKRLKGRGLGVRKVESAGRNQAVIVHTATQRHLSDLESLFSDVATSPSAGSLDVPVENLRNLGATSAAWMRDAQIHTQGDLAHLGATLAFRLVKQQHPEATLNLLWAIAGALQDKDWRDVSDQEKAALKSELAE